MTRLALVAILLLALVPTAGRFAQAHAASHDAATSWAELCTVQGLRKVLLPTLHETPAPAPHAGEDCEYCPLLAVAITPTFATISIYAPPTPPALCTSGTSVTRTQPHPCGLGSRGPPLAS